MYKRQELTLATNVATNDATVGWKKTAFNLFAVP